MKKSFRAEEYRIAQFVTLHFIKIKSQLLQAAEIPHLVMRLCFQSLRKKFILFIAEINSEPIKPYSKKLKIISNVEILLNSQIKKINGSNKVESITVDKNGAEAEIKVDGVFVAVGSVPNSAILKDLVEVDNNGYIVANEDGVTSANGIFVAGDVRTKKLRQVVTAVSDGANCVLSAEDYLEKIK